MIACKRGGRLRRRYMVLNLFILSNYKVFNKFRCMSHKLNIPQYRYDINVNTEFEALGLDSLDMYGLLTEIDSRYTLRSLTKSLINYCVLLM